MKSKKLLLIPLALFVVLLGFLAVGLRRDPHEIPSPLVGKPAPGFSLPRLEAPEQHFAPADLKGKVWLLNVWASWCVSCRDEHPVLVEFAGRNLVPVVGLDYKDNPTDAQAWLARFGNPYGMVAVDAEGRIGIDYGVYGVPETYVIDKQGVIAHKHIGPLTAEVIEQEILPLIRKLSI
ncbi:DsbE family thiol:disulfide interchange protein [Niveibacterium sp. SC-1]|uniref:DsbE family thiol:disulfide interchange protein n=1 Tax=Niveibacterium sp. SC-1 TaxID=3135646 RepID=UPI00311FD2FE